MRRRPLAVTLAASLLAVLAATTRPAPAVADEPLFVDWASLLPSLTDTYEPDSTNDCVAGRANCVKAIVREMERRFAPLGQGCDHKAVFALTYLRTTQTFGWARDQPGFFADPAWITHEAAVFARYYFAAYDNWAAGRLASVPRAWLIGLNAAAAHRVTGSGNLLLGINAHVNRDLPFALAAIGLTAPGGGTRKPDHDKVNEFLNLVVQPLLWEASARFDPDIFHIETPHGVGYTGLLQTLVAWREQAWRNAEALTNARTETDRALVAHQIEDNAAAQARSLVTAHAYVHPATSAVRDAHCAIHHADPAPMSYTFGTPRPY